MVLRDWWERVQGWALENLVAHGIPRGQDWLGLTPSGPHMSADQVRRQASALGGVAFLIDMGPRWVKRLLAHGSAEQAEAYAEHLIDQAAFVLRSQDIGVLVATPPMLARLCRRDELVELVQSTVKAIHWGGAHMDDDTRQFYSNDLFPGVKLHGTYGTTMLLGEAASEHLGLANDDPCIFDPLAPYIRHNRPARNGRGRTSACCAPVGQLELGEGGCRVTLPLRMGRAVGTGSGDRAVTA